MSTSRSAASGEIAASIQRLARQFESRSTSSDEPGWLTRLREDAMTNFEALGFPDRKLEEWRYTNVAEIEQTPFDLPGDVPVTITRDRLSALLERSPAEPEGDAWLAVFVDGRLAGEHSRLPGSSSGISIASLAEARTRGEGELAIAEHLTRYADYKVDGFTALNTAFFDDGAVIEVSRGHVSKQPIHLLFASTGAGNVTHPRVLIVARANSQAIVVQDFVSLEALGEERRADRKTALTNSVSEIALEPGAHLSLVTMQREDDSAFHVSNVQVAQQRDSHFASHVVTVGGRLVRNELDVQLIEEGASAELRGLYLGSGGRHVDNHTLVDHAAPHCTSAELYKGVLGDQSRGVFRGRVLVRPHSVKTDATQSNRNLLLSNRAEVDTKPQLEIYTDDVKCSHGATIGQLDEEALFYLRSRGIGEPEAQSLLARGFVADVTESLPSEALARWAHELAERELDLLVDGSEGCES